MKTMNNRTDKGFFAIHDKTTQCPYCKTIGEFTQSINKVQLRQKDKSCIWYQMFEMWL